MSKISALISRHTESELRKRAQSKSTDFEIELAKALHAGIMLMEIEELEKENQFLSVRITFMRKSIPQLENEIQRLETAFQQAEKDQKLMRKIVLNGGKLQHAKARSSVS